MIKVTGVKRRHTPSIKDFRIEYEGKTWWAIRTGNKKFTCEGFKGTLKAIKARIIRGILEGPDDVLDDEDVVLGKQARNGGTWDCIHPCAWIIALPFALPQECIDTLEAYGWLDAQGQPDWKRANREIGIFNKLKRAGGEPSITGKPPISSIAEKQDVPEKEKTEAAEDTTV